MRSVIFGVDGLTFRIIHPLMERGDLPNFRRLAEEGCEAVLESKYPPLTPPAWVSLSTGLKPARHGVYDYWEYEEGLGRDAARKTRVLTQRKGGKAIWNTLSEYGKQVLVVNVPVTYPPEKVNGTMVSGYLTPGKDADFTFPSSFKEQLFKVVPGYEIDIQIQDTFSVKSRAEERRILDAVLRMTDQRIKLVMHLLKERPWDFCYVVFVGADRLQHAMWESINSLDAEAMEYYRLVDYGLGLILEQLGPEDSLFVVSDHGFQGASRGFDINEYLYSKKLLVPSADILEKRIASRRKSNLKHALKQTGLLTLARQGKKLLPRIGSMSKRQQMDQHHVEQYEPLADIDWARTLAYVPSRSGFAAGYADIFLDDELAPERVAELCENLKAQVDPVTGKALLEALYTTEVYGTGPFAPREPHLLLLPGDGITFRLSYGNERFWDDVGMGNDPGKRKRCGVHQKDGVFYAYGGGIKRGFKAPNAEIYDVVPTILRAMGLPLPQVYDGRVLSELFAESERQADLSVEAAGPDSGGGTTRLRLKKLLEA